MSDLRSSSSKEMGDARPSRRTCSAAELEELKTAFKLLDRNHDGKISVSEFQLMLKNFGMDVPDQTVCSMMKEASTTGVGYLTEEEFLEWVQGLISESTPDNSQDLVAAFRVFDKDADGYITKEELKNAMDIIGEPVTDYDVDNMIEVADLDKDGRIDYEEFARLLTSQSMISNAASFKL